MSVKIKKDAKKLDIRQRRIFSEEFKRKKVSELISKQISVKELSELYTVSKASIYRWLYRYSPHHNKGTIQVVQMESEASKTRSLQERLAQLERVIGQKQMQIDFLEKLIELAGQEYKVDLKKTFSTKHSKNSEKL